MGASACPGFLGRDLSWMLKQEGAGSLPWQLPRGCKQPSIILLRALGGCVLLDSGHHARLIIRRRGKDAGVKTQRERRA